MSILSTLWEKVKSLFHSATTATHQIVEIADTAVNWIKAAEASPTGQLIESIAIASIPAATGLVDAFKLWLPKLIIGLNWATSETSKSDDQIIQDGLAYLASIKGTDIYAAQLNSLNALIQKWLSDNQGAGLNIQQALTLAQVNHNPDLVAA